MKDQGKSESLSKSEGTQSASAASASSSATANSPGQANDAITVLKNDHRKVEALFDQFEKTTSTAEKKELVHNICMELAIHTRIEEEIFYPACRKANVEDGALDEAQVEHDGAKILVNELVSDQPGSDYYDAKVTVLSEYIKHHVKEEEKPKEGLFAKAQQAGVDMAALGERLKTRKQELMNELQGGRIPYQAPRALQQQIHSTNEETTPMASYRNRDENGRFTDRDDDRGRSSGRQYSSQDRDRDEYGRFVSDDRSREGRGYDRDEDRDMRYGRDEERYSSERNYGGRRGQSGWYGDPEGHSRASREGWEHRGDYEDRSYSRGSSGDRYRRNEQDDERRGGGRGWYGDPEGHSQAARRGWEENGRSDRRDYEDNRSQRRGRDWDDDNRGHGGWFGDPEGHSQASRRGWQNR